MHHGTQSIRKGREAQMGQCLGFGRRQARVCNRSCPKNSRYAFGDYYSLNLTWNYRNQITKKNQMKIISFTIKTQKQSLILCDVSSDSSKNSQTCIFSIKRHPKIVRFASFQSKDISCLAINHRQIVLLQHYNNLCNPSSDSIKEYELMHLSNQKS